MEIPLGAGALAVRDTGTGTPVPLLHAGHWIPLDAPDALNELLVGFLAGHG